LEDAAKVAIENEDRVRREKEAVQRKIDEAKSDQERAIRSQWQQHREDEGYGIVEAPKSEQKPAVEVKEPSQSDAERNKAEEVNDGRKESEQDTVDAASEPLHKSKIIPESKKVNAKLNNEAADRVQQGQPGSGLLDGLNSAQKAAEGEKPAVKTLSTKQRSPATQEKKKTVVPVGANERIEAESHVKQALDKSMRESHANSKIKAERRKEKIRSMMGDLGGSEAPGMVQQDRRVEAARQAKQRLEQARHEADRQALQLKKAHNDRLAAQGKADFGRISGEDSSSFQDNKDTQDTVQKLTLEARLQAAEDRAKRAEEIAARAIAEKSISSESKEEEEPKKSSLSSKSSLSGLEDGLTAIQRAAGNELSKVKAEESEAISLASTSRLSVGGESEAEKAETRARVARWEAEKAELAEKHGTSSIMVF